MRAGEMLRLAGFSSGRGDCARGGLVCGAKQVCCGVFRSDHDRRAFLLECLAFDSRLPCVPVGMFFLRLRLVFAACASNRTACDMLRSYSAVGRDRHSCVLESPVRLSVFPPVHFRPERFFMAIPTEYEGAESAAQERFCVNIRLCHVSRGEYAGAKCGSRTAASLDSLHLIRGVGAFHAAKGTRV